MTRVWPLLILLAILAPAPAFADSSNLEGGVFIAHHPPGLQYTSGQDWCARYWQEFAIDSCSEQNSRIDLDGNEGAGSVWFVLAAWDEEKEWCGAEFGLAAYDSTIYVFEQWGPCFPDGSGGGLQIQTTGWPGPNAGVSLSISGTPWSGNFVPVYFFAGYAYYQGEIPLAVNPSSEFGGTANCETPPEQWVAASFGAMGIFEDGVSACPEGLDGGGGLDGGMQPDGADGYGGYEGDEGQGGEDDAIPCCFGEDCRMLTVGDCERLGGLIRAGWPSCDARPCRNLALDGSGDVPPEELMPLCSQVVYAHPSIPAVYYLDPGVDDELSFHVCTMQPTSSSTTLTIELYDPRQLDQPPFYAEQNVVVEDPPGHYVSGVPWLRESGMAKLVLTTVAGQGNYYAFAPLIMEDPDATDHEYFNANYVARPGNGWIPWDYWQARYRFWVPTMAAAMELRCLTSGGGDWWSTSYTLRDPEGHVVWQGGYLPGTYSADIPESVRGGEWELEVWSQYYWAPGDPWGQLRVSFRAEGATEWWTPDFAFSPVFETPVRAQLSPWELFAVPDADLSGDRGYYVPYGSPVDAYEVIPSDRTIRLEWGGRRHLMLAAYPQAGDRSVTCTYLGRDVSFTWHTSADPTSHYESLNSTASEVELAVPEGEILFIDVLHAGAGPFEIATDAPLAACGPDPGLSWGQGDWAGPYDSAEMTFYVPWNLDTIQMTFEAWRFCARVGDDECVVDPIEEMFNRAYPATRLVLIDPGGASHEFPTEAFGRLDLQLPLEGELAKYRGHAWRVKVVTEDTHTGLHADLVFGDGIPPYATWVEEKERFFLPVAYATTPRMRHNMSSYAFVWNLIPPADLYFASGGTYGREVGGGWPPFEPIGPAGQAIARFITPSGPAYKQMVATAHVAWLPVAGVEEPAVTEAFWTYSVPRPLGLREDGALRTTMGGAPLEARQFLVLSGATDGSVPGSESGREHLAATQGAGFGNAGVPWRDGPGWAVIAHQDYDLTPGMGLPGVSPGYQNWPLLESSAQAIADSGYILTTGFTDEPLAVGAFETQTLREAVYRLRLHDARHPIMMNEEPDLPSTRELRDIVDVWDEDQYSLRWPRGALTPQQRYPSCEVVTRLQEIRARVLVGTGVAIHLLGGFPDWRDEEGQQFGYHYVTSTRDSLGAELLSALLVGANHTSVFCKVFDDLPQHDLQQRNPALWSALPSITAAWSKVERWIRDNAVYDIGVRGTLVRECEWPPVTFGLGYWDEQLPAGLVGTWYAFCNLARTETWADTLSWQELHLAPEQSPEPELPDGASSSPPTCELVPGGLRVELDPGEWIVGRLVIHVDPGAISDGTSLREPISVVPAPNPCDDLTTLRVAVSADCPARVAIYDVLGRRIWESQCTLHAGGNTVTWDGRSSDGTVQPSGLYRVVATTRSTGIQRSCWVVRVR